VPKDSTKISWVLVVLVEMLLYVLSRFDFQIFNVLPRVHYKKRKELLIHSKIDKLAKLPIGHVWTIFIINMTSAETEETKFRP